MRISLLVIKSAFKFKPENRFVHKQSDGEAGASPHLRPSRDLLVSKNGGEAGASPDSGVDNGFESKNRFARTAGVLVGTGQCPQV